MGGTIGCHGTEGSGATFWVEIPARMVSEARPLRFDSLPSLDRIARGESPGAASALAEEAAPTEPSAPVPVAPASDAATLRVLVAEDTPVNQTVARRMLESLGCEVEIVENGQVAVERATASEFDLVLMDCQMPVMDGFLATHALRTGESEGPLPDRRHDGERNGQRSRAPPGRDGRLPGGRRWRRCSAVRRYGLRRALHRARRPFEVGEQVRLDPWERLLQDLLQHLDRGHLALADEAP